MTTFESIDYSHILREQIWSIQGDIDYINQAFEDNQVPEPFVPVFQEKLARATQTLSVRTTMYGNFNGYQYTSVQAESIIYMEVVGSLRASLLAGDKLYFEWAAAKETAELIDNTLTLA